MFTLTIKVKTFNDQLPLEIIDKGDWVDLRSNKEYKLQGPKTVSGNVTFNSYLIPLGVAMQLPEGFEAMVLPRSSTHKNYGIILANSEGVIDNSYNGDSDEWKFGAIAMRDGVIHKNDRIAQFRIQLSQKATMWQKLKWLLSSKIKFEYVKELNSVNRGGIGSTGKR